MKPLITENTHTDNYVTYLQIALAKIVANKDTLCFITTTDLTVTKVDKSDIKELPNHSSLTNINLITISKGTQLFLPLAELPFKQAVSVLNVQYALNVEGEYLHFVVASPFGYAVRHLNVNLLDGRITVQSSQPEKSKILASQKQLQTALDWFKAKKNQLGLFSIIDVEKYYKEKHGWKQIHYWLEWSQINPDLFPADKFNRNFFSKQLNPYKKHNDE